MARSRKRPGRKTYFNPAVKSPKWSTRKKIVMTILGILCGLLALLAMVGVVIKYYHLVSK